MSRTCQYTGRTTKFGHKLTRRGLPKAKGGVGIKTTSCTKRQFKANIQKVRAWIDGRTVRVKISTRALKKGLVTKPPQHKKNKAAPAAI